MIKVQELRIGNYVYCQDEINVIYGITKEGFIQYEKENSVYYCGIDEIKPIELTDEVLFKLNNNEILNIYNELILNDVVFELYPYGLHFTGGEGCSFGEPIEFLHELQNFVQLFSKKELQINL